MTRNTDNASSLSSGMDPVTFEVIRNAVVNLTEEMAVTVRRAAFSTNYFSLPLYLMEQLTAALPKIS